MDWNDVVNKPFPKTGEWFMAWFRDAEVPAVLFWDHNTGRLEDCEQERTGGWLEEDLDFWAELPDNPSKPAIEVDWNALKDEWGWIAQDEDERVFLYKEKPLLDTSYTLSWKGPHCAHSELLKITVNTTDWTKSLTKRPEGK